MQFTATSLWNSIAKGTSKFLQWKVYVKKTTDITEALTAGTWVEVTDRAEPVPSARTSIEMSLGQFTADSLTVRGLDRAWWKANVFNASASQYIEFKIELKLGLSESNLASDTAYVFSGFVDKRGYVAIEETNNIEFTVYTADEIGNRLIGENLTTQYINPDVDGSGTDGLILPQIPGLWVTDANIASFVLKSGVHVISYEYNAGTERAKLDDGDWLTLRVTDGTDTLSNADDSERITVYVDVSQLAASAETLEDDVIVLSAATLPKNWYERIAARVVLRDIFNQIGITSQTFDTMGIATWDTNPKVSIIDHPPNDPAVTGNRWVIGNDGTDIWVGVGDKVYRRVMATDTYELIHTFGSATEFASFFHHDSVNNDMWIIYGTTGGTGKLRRYDIDGASMSAEVTLTGGPRHYCSTLMHWTATTPDEVWLVYCDESSGDVRAVDGATLTDQQILASVGAVNGFMFWRDLGTSAEVYFQAWTGSQWNIRSVDMAIGSPGTWTDGGVKLSNIPSQDGSDNYEAAVYNSAEDRIYFMDFFASTRKVSSHPRTSNTRTNVVDILFTDNAIVYDGSDKVYVSDYAPALGGPKILYQIDTNVATTVDTDDGTDIESTEGVFAYKAGLTFFGGELFGLDYTTENLWKFSSTLALYIPRADFEGVTLKEALTKILQGMNLIANISPAKKALVFKRGNDSGVVQTTGNSITITTAEGEILKREKGYQPKIDYVEVTNGNKTVSYNGTDFNSVTPADSRKLQVSNVLIPDQIVKDVCYYMYQFWKTERDMVTIGLPLVSLFQYEPCDGATITGFNEVSSATGIIMGATYQQDGSMTLEILTPLS